MRTGVRLGIDVGKARVGVSRSDLHGMLATPVETVQRGSERDEAVSRVATIAAELEAFEVIVGLPLNMRGESTPSTEDALGFADALVTACALPVRLIDERLSTVSAQGALHRSGRNTKNSRAVIDQVAAVIILQHALDSERSSGTPPGRLANEQELFE